MRGLMLRAEALKSVYPRLKDQVVVTIMGAVAVEPYNLGHQPNLPRRYSTASATLSRAWRADFSSVVFSMWTTRSAPASNPFIVG